MLKFSKVCIAISDEMAKAYADKFKLEFSVLMNSVDTTEISNVEKYQYNNVLNFVYAGGLHLERWRALKEIADNLINRNARLVLYISERDKKQFSTQFENLPVIFFNQVPHDRIGDVFKKADVLVHAETNNSKILGFFKYSVSTKIPEYLYSGKTVLFYGPKEMGLYSYLKKNNVAFCASNKLELNICIQDIFNGPDMGKINRAYSIVREKHNSKIAREILRNTLCSAVSSYGQMT